MMNFTRVLKKMCFIVLCFAIFSKTANATIYTAAVSGNFSSGLTWGGSAPGSIVSTDMVIIPAGITVTMTSNEVFSGTSSLTVIGTLTAAAGTTLSLTSGTVAGAGTISVDSMVLGLTSGFTYTGLMTARKLTSLGATIASAANVKVSKLLTLASGTLNMGAGNLTMGNFSAIDVSGGTVISSGGLLTLDSTYNIIYRLTSATVGLEMSGTGFDSVTVNVPGTVTLAGSKTIKGVLSLTSGTLDLAGNTLTFGPASNVAASGTGTITGSALSNIVVNATTGLTGALRFAAGAGGMLNSLVVNTAGGAVTLGTDLSINTLLTLAAGTLALNGHTLTMNATGDIAAAGTGTITGSTLSNVIVNTTAGLTGAMRFATGAGGVLNNLVVNTTTGGAALGSDLSINNLLTLTSGALSLNGHKLTFNSAGNIAAGAGTITGSVLSSLVVNTMGGLTNPLAFTGGGNMLSDLTLNTTTGGATLVSDLALSGILTLTSGTLSLNGHTLTLNPTADVSAAGTGTITGSTLSNVIVNSTTGLTGALRFAAGAGGVLNNLVVNTASGVTALGSDLNINNMLIPTAGALALNGHTLTLNSTGNIAAGAGTITGSTLSSLVINTTGGLTNPLAFTTGGSLLNNLTVNTTTGGATLGSDLGLSGLLTLTGGTLALNGHTLTLNSAANVAASGVGTITGSTLSGIVVNATSGLTGALRFAAGAGSTLGTLVVNTASGAVTLGSDLSINSLLTLTAGTLSLNGHVLTLNTAGDVAASGTGTITGSTLSSIVVNTTGGLTGALRFAAGAGGTLNDLIVNTASGAVALGTDLSINDLLTLTSGALSLNGHTLTLNPTGNITGAGTITGSTTSSLVVNTTAGLTNPISFTAGSNMLNNLTVNTTTGGATLASDLGLSGLLTLTGGTLSLNGHTLTLNSAANVAAAGVGTITGSTLSGVIVNATAGLGGALRFAAGAGGTLNTFVVNTASGAVTLGTDLSINSLLTLTVGTLSLNGHTLTFNSTGDLSASGTGTITGSTLSGVIVNTTAGLTGAMRFATGAGGVLNNLVVNTTTGGAALGTDLSINNLLTLTSGALSLNGHTLTLNPAGNIAGAGTITGSTTSSLVINTTAGLTNPLAFTAGSNMLNNLTVNTTTGGATLGSDLGLSGLLTLTGGTLSLNGHTLTLNSAANVAAAGTGTITGSTLSNLVVNATTGLTGALRFAAGAGSTLGTLVVNTASGAVALGTDLNINSLLTLTAGTLSLNGHTLTLNAAGDIAASGTGTITGSTLSNLVVNTTAGLSGALRFAAGVGGTLNNLVVNTASGAATLGSNLSINNLLTLTAGTLALNGHALTLNPGADLSATGTGTLTGSALSDIIVNSTFSLTGALRFATGGNILNNLTVNMGSGTNNIMLGSNLSVQGILALQSGKIKLGAYDLFVAATGVVTGGTAGSYVVTDGIGSLTMNLATSASDTFKVGSLTSFAPIAVIANAAATTGNVTVHVADGVLSNGTTGTLLSATDPLVNTTWFVSSTATTVNYDMVAMWSAAMEVNSFNRANAYISHYTGGVWDVYTAAAAGTMGSMYTMTRTGITSLSPFMVKQAGATTTTPVVIAAQQISVYPNPAVNTLSYATTATVSSIGIYDITGKLVMTADGSGHSVSVSSLPAGTYFIHFHGSDVNTVSKFVKE